MSERNPPIFEVKTVTLSRDENGCALQIGTHADLAMRFNFTESQMIEVLRGFIIAGGKIHSASGEVNK